MAQLIVTRCPLGMEVKEYRFRFPLRVFVQGLQSWKLKVIRCSATRYPPPWIPKLRGVTITNRDSVKSSSGIVKPAEDDSRLNLGNDLS